MKMAVQSMVIACLAACLLGAAADDGAQLPVVEATDAAALKANMDKDVILVGTAKQAAWSETGRVMNITFNGAEQTGTTAVAFAQIKKRLDEAFSGDAAKTLTGKKLRIRGRLREYAGRGGGQRPHPEVTISDPSQITIVME